MAQLTNECKRTLLKIQFLIDIEPDRFYHLRHKFPFLPCGGRWPEGPEGGYLSIIYCIAPFSIALQYSPHDHTLLLHRVK